MKKKILIVEDDEVIAKVYANRFRDEGFDAETQSDGATALARVTTLRPDVVLLDLDLPQMHGLEVIKRVRSQETFQTLPMVVLTNAYQPRSIEEAWRAGASMCLQKASSLPTQVVAAVFDALSRPAAASAPPVLLPTVTSPVVVRAACSSAPHVDPSLHAGFVKILAEETARSLADMHLLWDHLLSCETPLAQAAQWLLLQRKVHALTGNATLVECLPMADLLSAFEALLVELCERPDHVNPSTLKTVSCTVDFLVELLPWVGKPWPAQTTRPRVLVVDDELIARTAAASALELVAVRPTVAEGPAEALALLQENSYDVVLLDVDMPGMTGFELCRQLRTLPAHQKTAVIFVTAMSSFDDRVQSKSMGGNDLVAKPYLLIELTVKVLTAILRRQLQSS